jgi:hypothetical protein
MTQLDTEKVPTSSGRPTAYYRTSTALARLVSLWMWGRLSSLFHARSTSIVLLVVLTIVDAALCLLAMYLIDLGISLMELWTELARKHLELTL